LTEIDDAAAVNQLKEDMKEQEEKKTVREKLDSMEKEQQLKNAEVVQMPGNSNVRDGTGADDKKKK
jgi:hypothetical protein